MEIFPDIAAFQAKNWRKENSKQYFYSLSHSSPSAL